MPTPNYGLLRNIPQPDPIGSALSAYQTVSSNRRANKATALAQRLGDLQAQKAEISIKNLPLDEALKQHQTQLANQTATLQLQNSKRTVHDTMLADIHQAPDDQKDAEYQKFRQKMATMHGDMSGLPLHYNQQVGNEASIAFGKTGQAGEQRKFARNVALEQMKEASALQVALAKVRAAPGEGQKQLAKSEAIANSKYKDSVIGDAGMARNILVDTDNITASLNQASAGYTGSLTNWDSPAGQELKKHTAQLVLDKLQGMHNVSRGTNLLMTIIKRSKPSDWMKRGAIQRIVSGMAAISHRAVEKERFTQYMWDHGIMDRGKIDTIFSDYDAKYPLINVKTNTVNTQNVGRWAEYLQSKQQKQTRKEARMPK